MTNMKTIPDPLLIDLPMPIVTPRLVLRPVQAGDGQAVHEAKCESWDELSPWNIWTWCHRDKMTVEDDEGFCRLKHIKFLEREDITLLSFDLQSGRFIGVAGLHKCDWEMRSFSLGYWVRTGETGKGYATEAATALLHYAFMALDARKVTSMHAEGNDASRRVLEKIGFEREGILRRQHALRDETVADEYVYGMLKGAALPPLDVRWGTDTP
jgi:RimJ/RimL family protein N-acetyltransferase